MKAFDRLLAQLRKLYHRGIRKLFNYHYNLSFSQSGEDMIVRSLFTSLQKPAPTYLDLGAHHPTYFSNTFHFYQLGATGVCVEPDPELARRIKAYRPLDITLNAGISDTKSATARFYVMSNPTLNTFSAAEAEKYTNDGLHHIVKEIDIPLITVDEIVARHFPGSGPDFVSLDIEGWEMKILSSFNFAACRPAVFCIETLTYSLPGQERKLTEIVDFMLEKGYMLYADTYINSIFVDKKLWESRKPC